MTKAKYTTEQRRRVQRQIGKKLAAWRREHPETPEQKASRMAAVKAGQEGMPEEAKKVRSEKLRAHGISRMSDPAERSRMSRIAKEGHRKNGYKARFVMTEAIKQKIAAAQKGIHPDWMDVPGKRVVWRERISKALAERFADIGMENHELFQPKVRQRAIANSIEEGKTNPLRGKFETNCHAEEWHLRAPGGEEYHFRNLKHFIRQHRHLFSSRQLEERGRNGVTRIERCLASLSPRNKRRVTRSQGWTWIDRNPRGNVE